MPSAQELDEDKKAYVSALNPVSALEVIRSEELRKIAKEVRKSCSELSIRLPKVGRCSLQEYRHCALLESVRFNVSFWDKRISRHYCVC